ncbi:class I SAM-dependent methyltransferase [Prauserella oleivorans]|uniref:Class I SAM-dependent methyltransferase n=1 Tax=Prauserella oleivorans TaxID=1478153 RepID=A0ABW5W6Z1_9PSEU
MNPDQAGGVFTAARQEFARWSARLWRPLGEIATGLARPMPGEHVLDACCGAGASAIPAALAVGPSGAVDAVDVAEGLLAEGRREAAALAVPQLRFLQADVLTWDGGPYDLVQCCYGVFFFPDMDAGAARLIGLLRPGGRFAVTTWLAGGMADLVPIGRAAAAPERPELAEAPRDPGPSARIDTPDKLREWLSTLGLHGVTVHLARFTQPLQPDDWWTFLLGSSMRGFVAGLPDDALHRVRSRFLDALARDGRDTLDASTIVGIGHRPA